MILLAYCFLTYSWKRMFRNSTCIVKMISLVLKLISVDFCYKQYSLSFMLSMNMKEMTYWMFIDDTKDTLFWVWNTSGGDVKYTLLLSYWIFSQHFLLSAHLDIKGQCGILPSLCVRNLSANTVLYLWQFFSSETTRPIGTKRNNHHLDIQFNQICLKFQPI